MIIAYVGTPGSGKTYEAVATVVQNLKRGRRIYTNIDGLEDPLNRRFIQDQLGLGDYDFNKLLVFLSKDEVNRFWEIAKDGSMIVLDEVHKNFSNREWNTERNKQFADWASTHRHHGFDVILITQDIEKVEKHVRSLIEWSYYYRKVNFFGGAVQQKYLRYSYTGDDHNGKPLAKSVKTYNPLIFKCYKSYATTDAKEVGFMSHVNILKHPIFFILPLVLAFGVYIFSKSSFASGDLFGTKKFQQKAAAMESSRKAHAPAQVPTHVPAAVPAPVVSPSGPLPPPLPPLVPVPPLYPSVQAPAQGSTEQRDSVAPSIPGRSPVPFYTWKDKKGILHMTNNPDKIPVGSTFNEFQL